MRPNCCKCGKCVFTRAQSSCAPCIERVHGKPLLRVITVTPQEVAKLEAAFNVALEGKRFIPDRDAREMMTLGGLAMLRCLAPAAIQQIKLFGTGQNSPVLVVKELPAQKVIPPSPFLGFGDDAKTAFADMLLFGIYALMGVDPVAFDYENHARLFRNVAPTLAGKGQKSSQGYDLDLRWHSDNPCGPFEPKQHPSGARNRSPIPRFLGFTGLRNADANGKPVPTRVLPWRRCSQSCPRTRWVSSASASSSSMHPPQTVVCRWCACRCWRIARASICSASTSIRRKFRE